MANPELDRPAAEASRFNPHAFLVKEWPYFLVLVLALSGVAFGIASPFIVRLVSPL